MDDDTTTTLSDQILHRMEFGFGVLVLLRILTREDVVVVVDVVMVEKDKTLLCCRTSDAWIR